MEAESQVFSESLIEILVLAIAVIILLLIAVVLLGMGTVHRTVSDRPPPQGYVWTSQHYSEQGLFPIFDIILPPVFTIIGAIIPLIVVKLGLVQLKIGYSQPKKNIDYLGYGLGAILGAILAKNIIQGQGMSEWYWIYIAICTIPLGILNLIIFCKTLLWKTKPASA